MSLHTYHATSVIPEIQIGDVVEIRDFSGFIPDESIGTDDEPGKWRLSDYLLIDGTPGKMLNVRYTLQGDMNFSPDLLPPVIEIDLPLTGRYAIYMGVPTLDKKLRYETGVDAALDSEVFNNVEPMFGVRQSKWLKEYNREVILFFKNADLNGGNKLRIRVPFGTFTCYPYGFVRSMLSLIRFERLPDDANLSREYGQPDEKSTKPLIVAVDGFSHYNMWGLPGECMDERLPEIYENTDVRMLFLQITAPMLWKSDVNNYFGENMTEEDYKGKRMGDIRLCKYMDWAIKSDNDPMTVMAKACHDKGLQFHFSIRANLYFSNDSGEMENIEKFLNGNWWLEHPEHRMPDNKHLDYGKPEVRKYYLDIMREVLERFDVDGISLDLTRWPRVLWKEYHDDSILIDFAREMRALLDSYEPKKGKKLALSMCFVEYYHAKTTLAEQAVDLEGLLKAQVLDFVCLQTWDLKPWADLARIYNTPMYGIWEGIPPYGNYIDPVLDPLWLAEDGGVQGDPLPGEEFIDQKPVNLQSPLEVGMVFDRYYRDGADGIYLSNNFLGYLPLRDMGKPGLVHERMEKEEIYGQRYGSYIFLM